MENHKYTLSDLYNMLPWEREIYVTLLTNQLNEIEMRREQGV